MKVIHNLTINLDNPAATNHIVMKQGDGMSRRLNFNIMANNKRLPAEEVVFATIEAIKPDGTIVHDEVMRENKQFYYDLIEQMTTAVGEVECEIDLIGEDGSSISSFPVYITVQGKVYDVGRLLSEDHIKGVKVYVSAAYEILKQVMQINDRFGLTYGELEDILVKLENSKEDYVTYIESLKKKVEEGYFNGENGAQGENGANGVIVEGAGIIGFQIIDGELVCYYFESKPPMEIDEDGNLIYMMEEK